MQQVLRNAVREAGEIIRSSLGEPFDIFQKGGAGDIVTAVDKRCEKVIIERILTAFPTHHILSEERGRVAGESDYEWIIDPLDGTKNFAMGLPLCTVSVAVRRRGQIILGAVYDPFLEEFFFAAKGEGAYLNDRRIYVSSQMDVQKIGIVTGFSGMRKQLASAQQRKRIFGIFEALVCRGISVRRLGASTLNMCWLAAGRFGAYYQLSPVSVWDIAAGLIILHEAGGRISRLSGDTFTMDANGFLASNGHVHDAILQVIHCY